MDIKQRRSLVDNRINDEIKFRHCCEKNYLNAIIQEREDFNSEEFYTSVGSREILAIFKAGEKNTPLELIHVANSRKHRRLAGGVDAGDG